MAEVRLPQCQPCGHHASTIPNPEQAKTGFKARVEAELAAANGESLDELKVGMGSRIHHQLSWSHSPFPCPRQAAFQQEERAIEHAIDHEVHTFSAMVDVSYNVRRLPPVEPVPRPTRSH